MKRLQGKESWEGVEFTDEAGQFFGFLAGSVGPQGESTGEFLRCETTHPLSEIGVETVNGKPVEPWE
jgi:hypothetical protein